MTGDLIPSLSLDPFSQDQLTIALAQAGFQETHSAAHILARLGESPTSRKSLAAILPFLLVSLGTTGDPDRVIANLDRFIWSTADGEATLERLAETPRSLEILIRLIAGSQFLTEILLRNPEYFDPLISMRQLAQLKNATQFLEEARGAILSANEPGEQLNALRRYQRRELLHIGTCDLLELYDLTTVTRHLSDLAAGLVQACLELAARQSGLPLQGFAVLGMGKLGGGELNYSSDIDLVFITEGDPAKSLRLSERLVEALASITSEGFLYRVDMRLRPWGTVGALVTSVKAYLVYLEKHARLWERQALLKARHIAGDQAVSEAFLGQSERYLYAGRAEAIRMSVLEMKQRTESQLRLKGQDRGEVKLGEGSIRDVEFVVQFLQLAYGGSQSSLRSPNTLKALQRLSQTGLLKPEEVRVLTDGYVFLRAIEHHLQLMDYRQTHTLPSQSEALTDLARRLGFSGDQAGDKLMTRYLQHSTAIRAVFLHYLGTSEMMTDKPKPVQASNHSPLSRHIERMDPSYITTFSHEEIQRHALLADRLDPDHLVEVESNRMEDGRWRVTIVAFDYLGELSLICGLMFVYGLNIFGGEVFTYEPVQETRASDRSKLQLHPSETRRKIVDVFTVQPERGDVSPDTWRRYAEDLATLLGMMHIGQRREARGELAKRVATLLQETARERTPLYPIEIEFDNELSERYTVLHIESVDTIGFLYELTNALAYSHVHIARVTIESSGNRVHDSLYVTDDKNLKLTHPERQRELRAAIVLIKHFTHLLPHSPNPVSALLHFREFMAQLFERPNWPDELASLERQEVLNGLAQLLGVSDFLWDDFLRMQYTNLFPVVRDVDALDTAKSRSKIQAELEAALAPIHTGPPPPRDDAPWKRVLNAFKDREMLRIDMRHILGHTREFWEFAEELTDLAEVVVNSAYHLTAEDLRSVYGTPYQEDGQISQMTVAALGKCGGNELGFASDIELMFIYSDNGQTSGPEVITSTEFHEKVVQSFVQAIYARREGIFEVDLQLRPYGKAGSLAVSQESFRNYYAPGGPAWAYERQALVKLRPIAGDGALGRQITRLRDELVYTGESFDVTAMRAMRERQIRHLVTAGRIHPKFSPGGLVDVEYLIQGLQITYGGQNPRLRVTNTRKAMAALYEVGILSAEDYTRLRKAHTFLRWLIDSLRVVRGNAKDVNVPPENSEEYAYLARRLRFGSDLARLKTELVSYMENVLEINTRLLR